MVQTFTHYNNDNYNDFFSEFNFPLSDFQKAAIESIVTGNHCLVTAHTGSGAARSTMWTWASSASSAWRSSSESTPSDWSTSTIRSRCSTRRSSSAGLFKNKTKKQNKIYNINKHKTKNLKKNVNLKKVKKFNILYL